MRKSYVTVELSLDDLYCLKAGVECAIEGTLMSPPDNGEQTAAMLTRLSAEIDRCTYHPDREEVLPKTDARIEALREAYGIIDLPLSVADVLDFRGLPTLTEEFSQAAYLAAKWGAPPKGDK